jgi:UDP-2-acetamido-3-amino-2,3-dideoxy-glucuronate N-acetyltransferase
VLAVVGAGYWGRNHVRNFAELGALRAICDANEETLAKFRETYPGVKTYTDLGQVLADPEIKAVVVATPAEHHVAGVTAALQAGRHVLVEKPMALHRSEAEELVRLSRDRRLVLMVGHLLEYHTAFVRLKELVAAGELGDLVYLYSNRLSLGKIRQEENVLWSLAPHDLSMILRLVGEEPASVQAAGRAFVTPRVHDSVVASLAFGNGVRAHVFVNWLHPFKEQRLVVVGSKKMAVFDDVVKEGKLKLYPSHVEWKSGYPVPVGGEPELMVLEAGEPLRAECSHFLECIQQGRTPLTDGKSGVQIAAVLEACQVSLEQGGREVVLTGPLGRDYFVHPTAVIDENCHVGKDTKIWHFSHILSNTHIGERCVIGQNVAIGPDVVVGNNVKIQNNVSIYKGVTLEDDVFAGPSCVFTNVLNPRSHVRRMHVLRPTLIRRGATLGANATVVCGTTIGSYAMIGAGSVVTNDVPDYALVFGVPARVHGWVCNCGEKLDFRTGVPAECAVCKRNYVRDGERVTEVER